MNNFVSNLKTNLVDLYQSIELDYCPFEMSSSYRDYKAEFKDLDNQILSEFGKDRDYTEFLNDPNQFRSLLHVTQLLKSAQTYQLEKSAFRKSEIYLDLQAKRRQVNGIIEKVVLYQHGGLNLTVDTMNEVVKSYSKGREEIRHLRRSLQDSREVLTSKKSSSSNSLRKLWLHKSELEETIRIISNIEFLKVSRISFHSHVSLSI